MFAGSSGIEGFSEEATNSLPPSSERWLGSGPVRENGINPVAEAVRSGKGLRPQLGFLGAPSDRTGPFVDTKGVSPESIAVGGSPGRASEAGSGEGLARSGENLLSVSSCERILRAADPWAGTGRCRKQGVLPDREVPTSPSRKTGELVL